MVIVKGIDNFFLVMTFNKELLSTFPVLLLQWNSYLNTRKMPWKGEKDPYRIWLSEIILQQTRVEQGMDYYNKFDYGFAGGIEVHPFKGLLVGARYNISLGNLYKDPSSYETNGGQPPSFIPQVNVKNNVFQLFVGWIFGNNSSKKKQTQTQPQQ